MKFKLINITLVFILIFLNGCLTNSVDPPKKLEHPCLIMQKYNVPELKEGVKKFTLLTNTFEEARIFADNAIELGIVVPFPKDPAGGYTHTQHAYNYKAMLMAGQVYQLTGEEKYAIYVRDMLLAYAELYPTLGIHPEQTNNSPGKLFWQGLNETVWLVYSIQAYDCVFDFISETERTEIESNLFEKMVHFFTIEENHAFNLVHNHGTWAVAGVGMAGIVMNQPKWVDQALYGSKIDSTGGFLKQIDELFSPDGYYTEGPYYQRYALLPFLVFSQALDNNRPDIKIFERRDSVLQKAVTTLMELTNTNGQFYPINDALKEKSWITPEMVFASNIIFAQTSDKELLDVAAKNGNVMLSIQGLKVARSYDAGESVPFVRKSMIVRDGPDGALGGLALLRAGREPLETSLMLKYSSQGMGHGHFDRLGYSLYNSGNEIITDYGSVRFINVESKFGGRYLPENSTWAKQTIAHNTVVLDGNSNFNGKSKVAANFNPELLFVDFSNKDFQIVSVVDSNCYEDAFVQRTMVLIDNDAGRFVVDLFRIENSAKDVVCDLPLYYKGHIIATNFEYQRSLTEKKVLGDKNGYQHLWVEGSTSKLDGTGSLSWMTDNRFYSYSFLADDNTEFYFTRIGANDQNFNLRNESGLMIRQKANKQHTFLSVLEMHGNYNPGIELVTDSNGSVENIELDYQDEKITCFTVYFKGASSMKIFISNIPGENTLHEVEIDEVEYKWEGNYYYSFN